MSHAATKNLTLSGLFAALMAICAWITIPIFDIGYTLQTFAVFLALGLMGGKWGTATIAVYLLLGAAGMPVFSGFRGGFGALLGITGGFLWGFLVSGLLYWALEKWGKLPAMAVAMAGCYSCGCLWFSLYSGGGLSLVLLRCVIPYLIPDALKIWLAYRLSGRLSRHIR